MHKKLSDSSRGLIIPKRSLQKNPQGWTIQMIQKIIGLQNTQGEDYLSRNCLEEIIVKIDKSHIEVIDKFSKYKQNGFNLLEFIRFFLNILQHQEIQNLYLTIGLIDLFKAVSTFVGQERVTFSHITNFLCQKILEKQQSKNQIQGKNIPQITYVKPNYQIKDFIRNPPTIYGSSDDTLYKLSQNSITTDKSKHNRAVNSSAFSHELKMVFTLDALSQHIDVYDFNCVQINKIYPSFSKIKKDVVVIGFAFSQRQSRIGAVLKNFSIIFWDCCPDNSFDYQKSWTTTSFCQHLQLSIYYLQYFNAWITSDKTGTIYHWDLLNSRPSRQFSCKYSSSINILCEIPSLNILAIVQESKQLANPPQNFLASSQHSHSEKKTTLFECNITLYNYFTGEILNEICSQNDRVPHTIQYAEKFQILFTAGLQKKIKLWEINPMYMDSNLKGQLIGHENLITSFTLIRKTSLLASCDDKGKIKLWDFKNFACIQTIDFSDKAMITNLLDMIEIGKIGILGSRIHYIDFEDKAEVTKKIKNKQKISIEWIDHDQCRNEIYVFTQKDLRVIDMNKGCVKYIYGCFGSNDFDYTYFKYFSCIERFALGNDNGQVQIYDISTGSQLYQLKTQHQGSIIGVEYDQLNKLFITIGLDSSILIHKEASHQLIRQIKGNFYGKQISSFELSVFHNLIAISTHEKQFSRSVLIWNYEFGKLSGEVVIKEGCEIVGLQFINGYNILVIATNVGIINLIKIKQLTGAQIRMQELALIELNRPVTSLTCDMVLKGGKKCELQECLLLISFQGGTFQQVNITNHIKKLQQVPHSKQKTNYNPYRQSKETFSMEYMKKKHFKLELSHVTQISKPNLLNLKKINSKNYSPLKPQQQSECSPIKSVVKIQTQIEIDLEGQQQIDASGNLQENELKIKISPENTYKSLKKVQSQMSSKSLKMIPPIIPVESQPIVSGFTQLNYLKIMNFEKRFILMIGNGRRIKIFTHKYKLICDFNMNYPLPYLWKFTPKVHKKVHDKIYFAIKVLNSILSKYESDITVGQAKNYKLKGLFDCLNGRKSLTMTSKGDQAIFNQRQSLMLTEPSIDFLKKPKKPFQQVKVPLIQQEYTKNDLNYHLVKSYNPHEVAGPTLKELDHIKKIELLQKQWRQKQRQQQQDCDKLLKMIQTRVRKNQEKEELATFLSPNKGKDQKQNGYILNLRKKIDNIRNSGQKQDETKDKQKAIPFLNTSKMMSFTNFLNTAKNDAKKEAEDKNLIDACMRKYKSVKSLKRLNTTSTFEDYYSSVKASCQSKLFKKSHNPTFVNNQEFKMQRTMTQDNEKSSFEDISFKKDTFYKKKDAQIKLQRKPFTSGSKFRRILTEMNERVREKKLEKIRFL